MLKRCHNYCMVKKLKKQKEKFTLTHVSSLNKLFLKLDVNSYYFYRFSAVISGNKTVIYMFIAL